MTVQPSIRCLVEGLHLKVDDIQKTLSGRDGEPGLVSEVKENSRFRLRAQTAISIVLILAGIGGIGTLIKLFLFPGGG